MPSKEGLIHNLPANIATKAEAGIVLGNAMQVSRANPGEVRGVQFFVVSDEGGDYIHLSILLNNVAPLFGQIDNVSNDKRIELENRLGEESCLVVTANMGRLVEEEEDKFLGGKLHAVWKPKTI